MSQVDARQFGCYVDACWQLLDRVLYTTQPVLTVPHALYRARRVAGIRGREWGGEEEVSVLAAVLSKTIVVHDISRGHELPYSPPSGGGGGDKIHLRYTRNEEAALVSGDLEAGGHYDLLVW